MKLDELKTIQQVRDFLAGTQPVAFSVSGDKDARYRWIQRKLVRFHYLTLPRADKGVLVRYLMRVTGYSRQQLTRLIAQYRDTGRLRRGQRISRVPGPPFRYTEQDIRLLAAVDERHDTPRRPTVRKLCERAYTVFGRTDYRRLAGISVSHLYNLRQSTSYTCYRRHFAKNRPTASTIGERRKPRPEGQPSYIRIDTVHQGDQDKHKGVYHINAVDEVTQCEVVCTVEKTAERFLLPAVEQMLEVFPFVLRGFNSDNGSEYSSKRVADMLISSSIGVE